MHYAFRKNCWENYEKMQFEGVGKYGIPELRPTDFVPEELLKFNYRGNAKDKSKAALHFYMYDYLLRLYLRSVMLKSLLIRRQNQ